MQRSLLSLLDFGGRKRTPIILQTEMAECGLACIAMISSFYGHSYDLVTLRNKFPIPLTGATLKSVIAISEQLSLSCRPIKVELNQLASIKTPAILHWDMTHFVVLESVNNDMAIIIDPASGKSVMSADAVSNHFTGVALELTPTKEFTVSDEQKTLRIADFWNRTEGLKRSLLQIFGLTMILNLFALLSPLYVQLVVDEAIQARDSSLLLVLAIGFAGILLIELTTRAFRSFFVLVMGSSLSLQVADNLFRHLMRLPLSYFEKRHMGDVVSRFGSIESLQELFTTGFVEAVVDGLVSVLMLVVLFLYSPMLAMIVVLAALTYLAVRIVFFSPLKRSTEESINAKAMEQSNFMESVRGIQTIKIFGKELFRRTLWQNRFADYINRKIRLGRYSIGFQFSDGVIFGLENILTIALGAKLILGGQLTVGMLYAFISYKRSFLQSAQALIEKVIEFRIAKLHLQRIADIAHSKPEELHRELIEKPGGRSGALELKSIAYRYSNGDSFLFEKVSLRICPGEVIAIVGPSGCGKSTLLKVMLGLLKPEKGKIFYGDMEIHSYGLKYYRDQVGAVMQEDKLFSGSIFDNISLFDSAPDKKRVEECARSACIHDEILKMPMAYNTLVGDMGSTLSGGQKQRLFIARALYHNPRILFMDEATSHLDGQNEQQVNENLKRLNMTRIIIAHRPSSIRYADRIFSVFDQSLVEIDREEAMVL